MSSRTHNITKKVDIAISLIAWRKSVFVPVPLVEKSFYAYCINAKLKET